MVPVEERATQAVYPSPVLSLLEIKLRKLLEGLVERGQITGCQVSSEQAIWVLSTRPAPMSPLACVGTNFVWVPFLLSTTSCTDAPLLICTPQT